MTVFEGSPDGAGRRVAVVAARFNDLVTRKLVDGALRCLDAHDVREDDVDVFWVPGAFEIPIVAQRVAAGGAYDAVVCLGAVIRGETAHFDLVANEAARGIADVARHTGVPVVFEVLAVDSLAQAEARAGGVHGNKGWEAVEVALTMASLLEAVPSEAGRTAGEKAVP
ncbi:MAG: 6,7-dimethyl-8-ribityllumazine synthase [Actinomycetota bacterium]